MEGNPRIFLELAGSKAVAMAASLEDGGELRCDALAEVACRGIRRGEVEDLEETARAAGVALDRLGKEVGHHAEEVVVNISGYRLHSEITQGLLMVSPPGRLIRREDVLQVVTSSRQMSLEAGWDQVMAAPLAFRIDGGRGISDPIGRPARRLQATTSVVIGPESNLKALEGALERIGRRAEMMVVQGMASGLGSLTPKEMEDGALIVDIGQSTTTFAAFFDGAMTSTAVLGAGAGHVTSDLAELLKTSPDEAERLKMEHGSAMSDGVREEDVVTIRQKGSGEERPLQRRILCEIIESRMEEIAEWAAEQAEEISRKPSTLVLTGGGSLMPKTAQLFGEVIGVRARLAKPKVSGAYSSRLNRPQASALLGMAKYVLEHEADEFEPASGADSWRERIRTLKSLIGGPRS
jgi:cell division protein FtsA